MCGSVDLDRHLHEMMWHRFGEAFEQVELRRKGPGSRFMQAWERVKRSFSVQAVHVMEIGPLNMRGVEASQYYDDDESMVMLSK